MKNNIKIVIALILVITWMFVIYNFSSKPSNESNAQSKGIINQVVGKTEEEKNQEQNRQTMNKDNTKEIVEKLNLPFRKGAHASIYFILSILVMFLIIQIKAKSIIQCNIIAIIICFIYACTDEYHQTFVIGRTGKLTDILIDTIGAMIGCCIFNVIYTKLKKNNPINIAKN